MDDSQTLPIEERVLERRKELDHLHRGRLRGAAGLTLGLRFLTGTFSRLAAPTVPSHATPVAHPAPGSVAVTFVGHGTAMLTTPATRVLVDPIFSNLLLGLRRARAAAIADADLAEIALVLITHAHHDHLHRASLRRLPRAATLVVPPRCADLVTDLGFARVVELGLGRTETVGAVEVLAVAARHDGTRGFPDLAHRPAQGYVVSAEGCTIYAAGDTGYFSGFLEIGQRFRPDVALLPIAGYEPAAFREGHLSPLDALFAFEDLGASLLVPVAHGSFAMSYEPLDAPLSWLRQAAAERGLADKVAVLGHGETLIVRRPPPRR